jgi:hypothetical protein
MYLIRIYYVLKRERKQNLLFVLTLIYIENSLNLADFFLLFTLSRGMKQRNKKQSAQSWFADKKTPRLFYERKLRLSFCRERKLNSVHIIVFYINRKRLMTLPLVEHRRGWFKYKWESLQVITQVLFFF